MKFFMIFKKIVCVLFLMKVVSVDAQLRPFSLISDNMVLQRNVSVPLWGTSVNSKTVTIEFNGQKKQATVVDGRWMVKLDAMKESAIPLEMHIKNEKEEIVIHNILIGEVWLAGGQSNMSRQLGLRPPQKPLTNWQTEAAQANYPLIREFSVAHNSNRLVPVTSIKSKWEVCDSQTVKSFSAVGYYFAKNIFLQLHIPVGIIHSSWGGSAIQQWISKETLASNPDFKFIVDDYEKAIVKYPSDSAFFANHKDSLLKKWVGDSALAVQLKKPIPNKPSAPSNPPLSGNCGGFYTTMIEPLIPYAMKGVIWYQGEANVSNPSLYRKLFPALIEEWRAKWSLGDFPFLFVQIAPFKTNTAELREAQLLTWQKVPNTAMVVTIDCGDTANIHPPYKNVVGERLSLAAIATVYHKRKLEYSGPVYHSYKIENDQIKLSFTHIGKGLLAKGEELNGFTITENGKDFIKAKAVIKKKNVIVSAEGINKPIAVRYAFFNNADGNLFNKEGLPATPFRTDVPLN